MPSLRSYLHTNYWLPIYRFIQRTPLALFLPWLFPFAIHMELTDGGVNIAIGQNGHVFPRWWLRIIAGCTPKPLATFVKLYPHFAQGVTYPVARLLLDELTPLPTTRLHLDCGTLTALVPCAPPADFRVVYAFTDDANTILQSFEGVDHRLGGGWFHCGNQVWHLDASLNAEQLTWLNLFGFPVRSFDYFLTMMLPAFRRVLPIQLQFQVIDDFHLGLHIKQSASDHLTVAATSNYPALLSALHVLPGDQRHLISGAAVLLQGQRYVTDTILRIAQSPAAVVLTGAEVPTFVYQDLIGRAQELGIDLPALQKQVPMVNRQSLQENWDLSLQTVRGIGGYRTAAKLRYRGHLVDIPSLIEQLRANPPFIPLQGAWLRVAPTDQLAAIRWLESLQSSRPIQPFELLGIETDLAISKQLSEASIAYSGRTIADRAVALFASLRTHGMPGGVIGQPSGIYGMLAQACQALLAENQSNLVKILWIVPSNKKGSLTRALSKFPAVPSWLTVASPSTWNQQNINAVQWDLIIFQEIEEYIVHASFLSQLARRWSLVTLQDSTNTATWQKQIMAALHLPPVAYAAFMRVCMKRLEVEPKARQATPTVTIKPTTAPQLVLTHQTASVSRTAQPHALPKAIISSMGKQMTIFTGDFATQAKQAESYEGHMAPFVPFMQYYPTYADMTEAQRAWYFYWRTQVRRGTYLPTDLSYLFVHIYETIQVIGFVDAQSAYIHLIELWRHYRKAHPKLDQYLVSWIADFLAVHNLAKKPIDWYALLLDEPDVKVDPDLLFAAWQYEGEN